MSLCTAFSRDLAPELSALTARVEAEIGVQPDPTLLPAAEGRAAAAAANRRWNRNLPVVDTAQDVWLPADTALGSARTRLRVLVPANAGEGAILFVHGGGFAFGSIESHERSARILALDSGLPVLMPDYRLAPEDPFPAGLKDVVAAMRAAFTLTETASVRPGPLILAGDSAGANLALSAILHDQNAPTVPVAAALLFYGVFDADFDSPSYRFFADGPGLTRGKMQRYWDYYVADPAARRDPLVCPLHANDEALVALPPLHLMAAGVDPLLSDTLALVARLEALGRPETAKVVPGVTHGFLQMSEDLPQARDALAAAAAFARQHSQTNKEEKTK